MTNWKIGVVGLGFAGSAHLAAFDAIENATVVAAAGKESDRLRALGEQYALQHTLADWRDLVALDEIDVVSIGTPNALHHPIAMAALQAGKHVLCEKPLALNAEQAREMVAAARENDRVLEAVFNYRHRTDMQWTRDYLDTEGIGRIYHTRASWKRRAGIPGSGSWFTTASQSGGGALVDLGPHVLDSMLHLLGEPRVVAVSAITHGELGRSGAGSATDGWVKAAGSGSFEVEDLASALLRFDDGSSAALEISWAGHTTDVDDFSMELLGATGGIRFFVPNYARSGAVRIFRNIGGQPVTITPEITTTGDEHGTVAQEFIKVLDSDAWGNHRGEFALHRTEIIDACYRSAAEGREVTL